MKNAKHQYTTIKVYLNDDMTQFHFKFEDYDDLSIDEKRNLMFALSDVQIFMMNNGLHEYYLLYMN